MKDDHMRNAQLKPGYNVQIAVESEYIVAADIFQNRKDVWTLVPFLKRMEEKLGYRYSSVTADSGYESEEGTDTYTCYAGKKLQPLFIKKQKSKSGYESEVTVYECEDCTDCPYKEKCIKAKGNKRLYLSKSFLEKRQESYENILSEKGIQYRMNRSIQVEGAFGFLKNDYEFQRILLLSMGCNLNKLHAKIQNDRMGNHLFPVKESA